MLIDDAQQSPFFISTMLEAYLKYRYMLQGLAVYEDMQCQCMQYVCVIILCCASMVLWACASVFDMQTMLVCRVV